MASLAAVLGFKPRLALRNFSKITCNITFETSNFTCSRTKPVQDWETIQSVWSSRFTQGPRGNYGPNFIGTERGRERTPETSSVTHNNGFNLKLFILEVALPAIWLHGTDKCQMKDVYLHAHLLHCAASNALRSRPNAGWMTSLYNVGIDFLISLV